MRRLIDPAITLLFNTFDGIKLLYFSKSDNKLDNPPMDKR